MSLAVLTGREASSFACFCDTVVAPVAPLPPVAATDAVAAFDRLLAASPALNRAAMRAMLAVAELAPVLTHGHRLRRLPEAQRPAALARLERHPAGAGVLKALRGVAHMSYYGDDRVMHELGYDADAVVARAARARERAA